MSVNLILNKTLTHSLIGGTIAKLQGEDFITGAVAAGTRELISPLTVNSSQQTQLLTSQLTGILVGGLSGGDDGASVGYNIATSAEIYNRQLHKDEIALQKTKNAQDLKKALAQTSNFSEDDIDNIFAMTQKAMVNEMDDYMLNLQLNTTYKDNKDEIRFVVNEAKQYFAEEARGQVYLDRNTMQLVPMMDTNNYNSSIYNPNSNSQIVKSTTGSLIRTGLGLVPNPYIAIPTWAIDTAININNNDFSNTLNSVQNLSPNLVGNPWANQNLQKIGAGISIFNTVESLDSYSNNIEKLEIQRDNINTKELQNIYNNINPVEIKKSATPQINFIKVNP
ncbi:hypothetical protein [Arcobacter sp. FWKO B]|uniref:hypothetical protein n=1 Tax=Arcobacter sp. FWKO B TaxID=2593672 RepID=UPI0018A356A9|nr:hypothetical protein [Arcobacter sp. FWKO B]QOG12849.1 hypothetical protein FWKOB_09155 [Arcobacter sp. FWKO B]